MPGAGLAQTLGGNAALCGVFGTGFGLDGISQGKRCWWIYV